MKKRGKLFVIDGSDGSGKATQTKMLVKKLKEDGIQVKTMDFPRYNDNFFGKFIGECLIGKYGNFLTLDPRITSVLYAVDRFESLEILKKWLDNNFVVILDRYVSANQIHQGGKIVSSVERKEFLKWLEKLEYGIFKLPRPDKVIYLDMPIAISIKLLRQSQQKKQYQKNGKGDLVEQSRDYLENARKSALWLVRENNNWAHVKCIKNGNLRTIEDIHKEIVSIINLKIY